MRHPFYTLLLSFICFSARAAEVNIYFDPEPGPASFAAQELQTALQTRGHEVRLAGADPWPEQKTGIRLVLADLTQEELIARIRRQKVQFAAGLQEEGFSIRKSMRRGLTTYWVIGADAAGAMYGGLEMAELIRIGDLAAVAETDQNAYMAMRGTKFNIPLDVRTPSYSDAGDPAQHNIPEMWRMDFWREYIDNLARYRYNYISLWNLHPFPSMVQVPAYPDVALADVQRSTVKWNENYSLQGRNLDQPEVLQNVEVVKKMTIEEKMQFWRDVMAYGKSRNVDFYVITWNIFDYGIQGKYGITDDIHNATTIDYFRQSVKQMFLTYPDLQGIGLTTGENMEGASFEEKEEWAFQTYAQGVLDAAKELPGRKITFIHRQHQTGAQDIARRFQPLIDHPDIEFIFSFKYAQAHVYSSTTQTFHQGFVRDIQAEGNLKTIWTLRNDDIYYFRWGAPDFVREFIQNIPYDVSRGYYYGSDQYVWGREFLSKEPTEPRQLEIVKHWYQWLLWGRLGYDPTIRNDRFIQIIQARFPGVDAPKLFTAWQEASLIYPKVTGFHWGALDFQWYIEACQSRPGPAQTPDGFHDVNRFISLPPHPGTNYQSIPEYVRNIQEGKASEKISPPQLATELLDQTDRALALLAEWKPGGQPELRQTLEDIRTIAYLGKYYGHKIRAATDLALFRVAPDQARQALVIEELKEAARYWRMFAAMALANHHNPLWTNRVGQVDWRENFNNVLYELTTVGADQKIPSLLPTPGGTILEAEQAAGSGTKVQQQITGFTGSGYLEFQGPEEQRWVEWTFEAPEAGTYTLEIRHAMKSQDSHSARLVVNGREMLPLALWNSGDRSTWVWDRTNVLLTQGVNKIRLIPVTSSLIDHLNVLFY